MASEDSVDWDTVSYVAASKYRTAVLRDLVENGPSTPTKISDRLGESIAHVSRALGELRQKDLVELLVPEERRKGRIYGHTDAAEGVARQAADAAGGGGRV